MAADDGFEAWVRAEVVRLREKADLLEALLANYESAGRPPSTLSEISRMIPAQASPARATSPPAAEPPSKKGRNVPLMKALEAAGAKGLTVDEVHRVALQAGLGSNRATVRSYLWNQRNAGRVVLRDDRFVVSARGQQGAGDRDASLPAPPEGN